MVELAGLVFYTGVMGSGKSTSALQLDHNHRSRGRRGILYSSRDRSGKAAISSRLGLTHEATEVTEEHNFWKHILEELTSGGRIDYLVCDEAQFYEPVQIDQLAKIADELDIDVYCFGILTDFRTQLFAGSKRLIELSDRVIPLQIETLCWCGQRATHNARTQGGVMVTEGEQIVVGDTTLQAEVGYEVLCRRHHRQRVTSAGPQAAGQLQLM